MVVYPIGVDGSVCTILDGDCGGDGPFYHGFVKNEAFFCLASHLIVLIKNTEAVFLLTTYAKMMAIVLYFKQVKYAPPPPLFFLAGVAVDSHHSLFTWYEYANGL